jgi:hypothetical protein
MELCMTRRVCVREELLVPRRRLMARLACTSRRLMARLACTSILIALVATCASAQAQQQRGGSTAEIMSSIPGNSETINHWYKQNVYDPQDNKIGEIMDVLVDRDGKPETSSAGHRPSSA